jgi:hypothetical protein
MTRAVTKRETAPSSGSATAVLSSFRRCMRDPPSAFSRPP